jgi:glutamate formiminotransferase/glutamate formiminotransferase/formiminotetrahydrofolate cyclodeaminase
MEAAEGSLVSVASPILFSVPNVSEGRDAATIAAIGKAFAGEGAVHAAATRGGEVSSIDSDSAARLIDVHSDGDHHRSVYTLAGNVLPLADALISGGRASIERVDVVARAAADADEQGQHPYVGALDVVPIVYLDLEARGAALAAALLIADRIGEELAVPVFLYGELTASAQDAGRTRAELRRGGVVRLAQRIAAGVQAAARGGEASSNAADPIRPDFGPARLHPTAGATLVAARPPLVAFNLLLRPPATPDDARRIASLIREGAAGGLPGLRAIGITLDGRRPQVSMNVERPLEVPLAAVVEAVARYADIESAELVGLAPRAALEGFPPEIPMPGFDPARHVIENAIGW